MCKHYLIVDIGTGNSRVCIIDSLGTIIAIKTFENAYYIDELYEDAQYFSPSYWKTKILGLCKDIIQEHKHLKIDAISSSGARESIVLIDAKGDDFYGLPNIDNRGKAWMHEITNRSMIYKKTGRWVTEDFPAAKLLGLKKKRREIYNQMQTFTSLSEWMGYVFTNINCIEPSQACETQLYDMETKSWSNELISIYGFDGIEMPMIKKGGTRLANITEEMKAFLEVSYDIPFIVGGADTQVALYGANIQVGDIGIVSGTTSPIVTLLNEKFYDKEERCWTDCFVGSDAFQVETNPGVTGLNYQRIRNLLFENVSYADLEAGLKEVTTIKCTASFSSLNFEKACSYNVGGFLLRPPFSADIHRIDLAWAIVGDIACSIYYQYLQLNKTISLHNKYILGCGGGFQSDMLCQHIADLTGKELKLPKSFQQASILGCMKLCNTYHAIEDERIDEYITYKPKDASLVHTYYKLWNRNREKMNVEDNNPEGGYDYVNGIRA